jgi:hypothetical protein
MNKFEAGQKALQLYVEVYAETWPDRNQFDIDELNAHFGEQVSEIGQAVLSRGLSDFDIKNAMRNVAIDTHDQDYPDIMTFFIAINKLGSLVDMQNEVIETTGEIASTAKKAAIALAGIAVGGYLLYMFGGLLLSKLLFSPARPNYAANPRKRRRHVY